ncbi:hypothetical protein KY325_04800, partial [Candidatus Woesearchaeota archaeon]|nr:hypothetical protein [Candidatus Woesearchaeota archaeon]
NHNLRLPRYIKELVKIVDAGFETKRYRSIALKALEDFVLVLFKTRRDVVTDNYWTLLLHCNKTESIARELGEDVVGLLYYLFPKAEITEDNLGKKLSYNKKRVLWNARIYLKKENLEKLRTHYPSFYKRIDDGKI